MASKNKMLWRVPLFLILPVVEVDSSILLIGLGGDYWLAVSAHLEAEWCD